MKVKAVMYGAGNIGRGFIGMLFSASGYEVTFVDVAEPVVEALNRERQYPVRIVSNEGYRDIDVLHVSAVNGKDSDKTAQAIAEADVMATAVGVNILKFIVPNLAAGIRLRRKRGKGPLNIIICENLMDANKVLEGMLKAELTAEEAAWFDENIGLVEASIGRMVPVQTEEMKAGNSLRVCVESYGFLPVDKAAFRGEIPDIQNMIPFEPFDFYIKRKLYVHNMGHAVCAYLGLYTHQQYIFECMEDIFVQSIVQNAMLESALALSRKYGTSVEELLKHIQNLLCRFKNRALKDTCTRVGREAERKLAAADRLVGASRLVLEYGGTPVFISIGTAGAIYEYLRERGEGQSEEAAEKVLCIISGLDSESPLYSYILSFYRLYLNGVSVREMMRNGDCIRGQQLNKVI